MATGGPNGRYRPPSSPSLIDQNDSRGAHSSSLPSYRLTSDHYSSDSDTITRQLVNEIKAVIQEKIQLGHKVDQSFFELEVSKIKQRHNPEQYDMSQWKRSFLRDIPNCPESILRASRAYGTDPRVIKPILKSKISMYSKSITNTSLDNIIEPLRRLGNELKDNPMPDLFDAVRSINVHHTNRAERLFLSEIHRFDRAIQDYKFEDAQHAVQAIRRTNCKLNKPEELLSIIKTCRGSDEVYEHLINLSRPSTTTLPMNELPSSSSRFFTYEHQSPKFNHNTINQKRLNQFQPLSQAQENSFRLPDHNLQRDIGRSRYRSKNDLNDYNKRKD